MPFPILEWLNKDKLLSTANSVCKIIIIWKIGLNTKTSNFFIYPLIVVMDVKRVANVLGTINCEGQQSFLEIHHRCKLRHQTKLQSICFLESFLFVASCGTLFVPRAHNIPTFGTENALHVCCNISKNSYNNIPVKNFMLSNLFLYCTAQE